MPFLMTSAYDKVQLAAMGLFGMPQLQKPIGERRLLAALGAAVSR